MRRESILRIGLAVTLVVALGGCRAFRNNRNNRDGCSTCATAVGGAVIADSSYFMDGQCTTCQKSFDVAGEPIVSDPAMIGEIAPELILPGPSLAQESRSISPEEQPLQPEPPRIEEPRQPVRVEAAKTPAGLNVDLKSSVASAMAGQEVTFEITLANMGGTPIESIDMAATLTGLRAKSVSPDGVARIDGNRVAFDAIKSFAPMTLTYKIIAEVLPGQTEGRVSIEVKSPILKAGPLTEEAVIRVTL